MSNCRRPRPLPEGLSPIPVSAGDFRAWSFKDCLMWASGEDGLLKRKRLKHIAWALILSRAACPQSRNASMWSTMPMKLPGWCSAWQGEACASTARSSSRAAP